MPKVTGPMFSLRASGTYAKSLTFGTINGRNIVRQRVTPRNPDTPAQQTNRAKVAEAATVWQAIGATPRANWQTAASPLNLNGYAYFIQQYYAQASTPTYPPSIP